MNTQTKENLDLQEILRILSKQTKISKVILFGSRAKGTHRSSSDWDLALQGETITLEDILSLLSDLDEIWLPTQVDLIIYDTISNPALKEHIDRVGRVVWSKS